MNKSTKIFRILTCVFIAFYTLLVCFYVGDIACYECMSVNQNPDGAYTLAFDRITGDTWFYILSGVVRLMLCASR
ncbi:MAG: hypothetical protein E7589_00360 [Ruminococcaceae bacterium]|nr:hypothetical protein [Oscillospiraceae bacterium]